MTSDEKLIEVLRTISRMRNSLERYSDCESKRAKLSVLRVIEGVILNDQA